MGRRVVILGSTGSIGVQALDVVARAGDDLEVVGLSALSDVALLTTQASLV
jgi:1-deoxy-D-xylulose-5-phosphate reductoisomerase